MITVKPTDNFYSDYWKTIGREQFVSTFKDAVRNKKFLPFIPDAWEIICTMTQEDFQEFKHWWTLSRLNLDCGPELNEKWTVVAAPEVMYQVHKIAYANKIPWGTAFLAAKEQGFIEQRGNSFFWHPGRVPDKKLPESKEEEGETPTQARYEANVDDDLPF